MSLRHATPRWGLPARVGLSRAKGLSSLRIRISRDSINQDEWAMFGQSQRLSACTLMNMHPIASTAIAALAGSVLGSLNARERR